MAKRINDNAMGQLLEGLTSGGITTENTPIDSSVSAVPSNEDTVNTAIRMHPKAASKERVCTSLDKTLMSKIRTISEKEGIQINELITLGLNMVVGKYEDIHGVVRPKKGLRGDISKLFR